jgi:NADP-reducing hydrogenase subunit HndB
MAKMSLEDLRKLRDSQKQAMEMRDTLNKTAQIIVGMGTSGIAAGAKKTLDALSQLLVEHNLTQVSLRQAGSIGLDHAEPVVEVRVPGMPDTIYGRVNPDVARLIVTKHVIGGELVSDHVFDRPAIDIVSGKA